MSATTVKITPITMSKLYIGNLPAETSENALRQLFLEQNLSCTNILVKRGGYAFVDCTDQSSADKAIDKLNGKSLTHSHTSYGLPTDSRTFLRFKGGKDLSSTNLFSVNSPIY